MNNKTMYYIASLVLFIVGVAIIGIHVNNYRSSETYTNLSGTTGSDENLLVTGRITATSRGHQLGRSMFPDSLGNVILTPENSGQVRIKGDTVIDGAVMGQSLCLGNDKTTCINKTTIDNVNRFQQTYQQEQPAIYRSSVNGTKCLDVAGANPRDGNKIQMWDCNGTGAQKFTYSPTTKQVKNVATGKCLDVERGVNANGTRIQLMSCNPDNVNQKFSFNPVTNAFHWVGNPARCVDRPNGSTANGAEIRLWDCNSSHAQTWY